MAFFVFLFAFAAFDCLSIEIDDSPDGSEAIAATEGQPSGQILAADAKSSIGSLEKSGLEMVTNRRKVLTESSTLADLATRTSYRTPKETVLVIQAANNKSSVSASQQNGSNCDNQKIGLTYKDSTNAGPEKIQPPKGAPNVVYIVLDDVGFGHIGSFGGPIETPNIDRLAEGGLRYSNFHTTALCSPSRACFMTGRNHHSAGIGALTDMAVGYPGYNGNLSKNTATLAEMLQGVGYNTFALGKWHLVSTARYQRTRSIRQLAYRPGIRPLLWIPASSKQPMVSRL